jgi:hypothetical protein
VREDIVKGVRGIAARITRAATAESCSMGNGSASICDTTEYSSLQNASAAIDGSCA